MGFEPRAFPPLAPLGLPPAPAQAAGGGGAFGGGGEAPAPGAGSIIAHFFAELAQEAEGNLPILASQWHEAPPRCGAAAWWEALNMRRMLWRHARRAA